MAFPLVAAAILAARAAASKAAIEAAKKAATKLSAKQAKILAKRKQTLEDSRRLRQTIEAKEKSGAQLLAKNKQAFKVKEKRHKELEEIAKRIKDSGKTHDTLGRKIYRGSERKSPKSLPHVKARTKAAKKAQLDRRAEHMKEVKRLEKVKDDKRIADSFKRVEAKIKVQKIPEGKSSSQAEVTGKKITTKEEAKRIREYIKIQKMLDDYTN